MVGSYRYDLVFRIGLWLVRVRIRVRVVVRVR